MKLDYDKKLKRLIKEQRLKAPQSCGKVFVTNILLASDKHKTTIIYHTNQ